MSNSPLLRASGSFEASAPFDTLVDPSVTYSAEALRTVKEMQGENIDIYEKVLKPAGIPKDETVVYIERFLTDKVDIVALTSTDGNTVYIPNSHIVNMPIINGVPYDHLCIIVDYGAVPPTLQDTLAGQVDELEEYFLSKIGVRGNISFGAIPSRTYVSKEQAELFEISRQLKIAESKTMIEENESLKKTNLEQQAYIEKLQDALKEK